MQLAGGVAAAGIPQFAHALDYPTRPVRVIVGFPPGGSADIVTRIVAQALSERLGQSFIVDNRVRQVTALVGVDEGIGIALGLSNIT